MDAMNGWIYLIKADAEADAEIGKITTSVEIQELSSYMVDIILRLGKYYYQ